MSWWVGNRSSDQQFYLDSSPGRLCRVKYRNRTYIRECCCTQPHRLVGKCYKHICTRIALFHSACAIHLYIHRVVPPALTIHVVLTIYRCLLLLNRKGSARFHHSQLSLYNNSKIRSWFVHQDAKNPSDESHECVKCWSEYITCKWLSAF